MSVSDPPVRTAITGSASPSLPWLKWFQSVKTSLATAFSGTFGTGNGAMVAIETRAQGSGSGPANPAAVVAWAQVQSGSDSYWVPLFK